MKKIIFTLAILIGLTASNFSIAGDRNDNASATVELSTLGGLKFRLYVASVESKSSIVIKDNFGEILYSANLPKSENYTKVFDFSTLRDGNYVFVINNGDQKTEKPISIETQTTRVVVASR
mgnify:CR=1 FL=1|tara:strand:- start:884 stop:1246 length:363 start_codon:yes stop_codon:yes gene_type:complete